MTLGAISNGDENRLLGEGAVRNDDADEDNDGKLRLVGTLPPQQQSVTRETRALVSALIGYFLFPHHNLFRDTVFCPPDVLLQCPAHSVSQTWAW